MTGSHTPTVSSLKSESINSALRIKGIDESTISQYFQTMNAGDFSATSQLFAPEGQLHPPFENPIVGPKAIAAYLEEEATGMVLTPREGMVTAIGDGYLEIQVGGQVQTAWFGVNVAWMFILNPHKQIERAGIKLLASPEELLTMRR